jgi:hypothetical protein|tara:strand:- start:348 stop:881 length:534 start_codon:yes stop_codon:yes gene_type:complete
MKDKKQLMESIRDAITEVKDQLKAPKSLSKYNPEKVATILYLHSIGVSQTQMVKKYGIDRITVINILLEYADYTNKWRKLGAVIRGRHFLSLSSLSEDLVDSLRDQMEKGKIKPTFRDLLPVSIALEKAEHGSNMFRGEATQIIEERKVVTQADYEATIEAAKKRMLQIKKAEAVRV